MTVIAQHRDTPLSLVRRLNWPLAVALVLFHGALVAVPFTFTWSALAVFLVLHWLSASPGISLCFHRLLTHRGFRLARPVEIITALCGCLAWQGSPMSWVATHRKHHSTTDREGDPHTPRESFWWGHVGWLLLPPREPRYRALVRQYAPDLLADPFYRFLEWSYPIYQVALGVVLYLLGGWSWVVWGIVFRTVVVWHSTWLVNSATHLWGYRNFKTKDDSTNLWWVAFITYGEGWHNNHHGDPKTANYSRRWWEFDPTYLLIRFLQLLRLAWDVRGPRRSPNSG
jgi:stearoyl-CoA desaturase (delta-9 desaturase)